MLYSESLFATLSFLGMWAWEEGGTVAWAALPCWAAASATRSNGVLLCGFPLFRSIQLTQGAWSRGIVIAPKRMVRVWVQGLFQSAVVALPLVVFQLYGYLQFCAGEWASHPRPWCQAPVPYIYGFVQKHYWDVGFLRYFELKQAPNFLLATPMIILSCFGIGSYACNDCKRFFSLGFWEMKTSDDSIALSSDSQKPSQKIVYQGLRQRSTTYKNENEAMSNESKTMYRSDTGYFSKDALVFHYMWLFMLVVGFCFMHVQVITRFLSACPPVYWYSARVCSKIGRFAYLVWFYFIAYYLIGTFLFVNFYPWT
mmetsp:Transcript_24015/g.33055  ORF Transcript_24015/g.33055 Transcript_24015/m.33055 type:complete len:312 (-) Transcript_24015:72-1007(-)